MDDTDSPEDALLRALLARVALAERTALAELYDRTAARVYRFAHGITGDAARAEAVTEDVYWQLWREAPRLAASLAAPVMPTLLVLARRRARAAASVRPA